jgi:CubicO group peptidase (beta-lactamase class C family)
MLRIQATLLLTATGLFLAATHPLAASCPFAATTQRFETLIQAHSLEGGALLLGDTQGLLLERYFGAYDVDTRVRIASATKLLSAVRIAQLAEDGALELDAPVSDVLPQFTGLKGSMTVAQMFSHTSGYGDDAAALITLTPNLSLAEAVDTIACCIPFPTGWIPGGQFAYGGISMHVAGRVAEVVGGGDWQAQWQERIGAPLGITSIDYEAFNPTTNYGIGGSARSTLRDYGRVLRMLLAGGWSDGERLMFDATVDAILTDRVGDLPLAYAPANAVPPVRYGLGNWLDATRSGPDDAFAHSLGAFGFFPFIDRRDGFFGVFMIEGPAGINTAALSEYYAMLDAIRTELAGNGCDRIEWFGGVYGDGFESPRVDLALPH